MSRRLLCVSLLAAAACETEPPALAPEVRDTGLLPADTGPSDTGEPPDAGVVEDLGPADTGIVPDSGAPDMGFPDTGAPDTGVVDTGPTHVVRFIAMGDTGEGNTAQYDVSAAIETVCMVQGCDFALLLGDNFYDDGVFDVDDDQFRTKFEEPYANLQLEFYATLGNHDFGLVPVQFWRTDYQIDYSAVSPKWSMPDHFYTFVREHVTFMSLDTNMIMLGLDWVRDQKDWVREQLGRAQTDWVIAYGHHPYLSNGPHGNAGNYEGLRRIDITGLANGEQLEDFIEDELCGNIDLYLSGHDHSRQWLEPQCGTEFIVSGAGAKTTEFEHRDNNPTIWESDAEAGFFWIEIADDVMTVESWTRDGQMQHRGTVVRQP